MVTDTPTLQKAAEASHRASFFRQSGWLMISNVTAGVLMYGVHLLSKRIPAAEYGLFGTLLAVAMCVPTIPLQTVLAQQTARALATGRERELAGTIRLIWLATFLVTVVLGVVVWMLRESILRRWEIGNPLAVWVTLAVVLFSLWMPIFWGVLQGRQNFLWLGWSMMSNGLGRVVVAVLAVAALGGYATGMMTGVLMGLVAATVIGLWQTRDLWSGPALPFDWRELARQVVPLMAGFTAFQFVFTADTMFVKAYFDGGETGFYVCAGTLSRALMWAVIPLATVMFPRLVHSAAKSEKSNLMGLVLMGTAILAILGSAALSVLGPWIVPLVAKESYVRVATAVLPWYVGAMVPLALANVLLSDLLARSKFKVVLPVVLLALAYAFILNHVLARYHDLVLALKTLGIFSLLLLGVCVWFAWREKHPARG